MFQCEKFLPDVMQYGLEYSDCSKNLSPPEPLRPLNALVALPEASLCGDSVGGSA